MIGFDNRDVADAIAERAGVTFNTRVDQVLSRVVDGELYGGAIFRGYTGCAIEIHIAGFRPDWLNRELMCMAFWYPFMQLKCERVFAPVPSYNEESLAFTPKAGFKEVAVVPKVFGDQGDLIVFCMEAADCRWLKVGERYGWEKFCSGGT